MRLLFLIVFILSLISSKSFAHVDHQNSAKIVLREGQVELRLFIDIREWVRELAYLQKAKDSIQTEITEQKEPTIFRLTNSDLKQLLADQIQFAIEDEVIALNVEYFPDMAAGNELNHQEIILTGSHKHSSVDNVSISFPQSLGDVSASFSKPLYRMISKGKAETVTFSGK